MSGFFKMNLSLYQYLWELNLHVKCNHAFQVLAAKGFLGLFTVFLDYSVSGFFYF